jgi:NADH-quinone oxidoreductase subunit J
MTLSGWEALFFWVVSLAALIASLLTILARNAVHSALSLISALISIAALFILLGAEFIAGVQILVYVGGVMVLFLFVIMLVNVSAEERGNEELFNSPVQVISSFFFALLLASFLVYGVSRGFTGLQERYESQADERVSRQEELPVSATGTMRISRDTERVGASLYRYAALPFEIASLLLLVAIVGSVLLARTRRQELAGEAVSSAGEDKEIGK